MHDPEDRKAFYLTKEWRRARAIVRASVKRNGLPCGYCQRPFRDGEVIVVDHKVNRRLRPDLALELSNLQGVHWECNTAKYYNEEVGNRPATNASGFPVGSEWDSFFTKGV